MNVELVINSTPNEVVIGLLNDKRLIELHKEKNNVKFSVGDIYLGRVKKVMTGLNAAFVDVGYEKDAFLHYLDLGAQANSLLKYVDGVRSGKQNVSNLMYFKHEAEIAKDGKIDEIVKHGQYVLVQVAKEPISSKGPRITTEISIAGRYMVLIPFTDKVSVKKLLSFLFCFHFFLSNAQISPGIEWQKCTFSPRGLDGQFQTQEQSGEEWWYSHKNILNSAGQHTAYITCGYTNLVSTVATSVAAEVMYNEGPDSPYNPITTVNFDYTSLPEGCSDRDYIGIHRTPSRGNVGLNDLNLLQYNFL